MIYVECFFLVYINKCIPFVAPWQALQVHLLPSYGAPNWNFPVLVWPIKIDPPTLQATGYTSQHVFLWGMCKASNSKRHRVPGLTVLLELGLLFITILSPDGLWPLKGSRGSKANSLHSTNMTRWPWPLVTQKKEVPEVLQAHTHKQTNKQREKCSLFHKRGHLRQPPSCWSVPGGSDLISS